MYTTEEEEEFELDLPYTISVDAESLSDSIYRLVFNSQVAIFKIFWLRFGPFLCNALFWRLGISIKRSGARFLFTEKNFVFEEF